MLDPLMSHPKILENPKPRQSPPKFAAFNLAAATAFLAWNSYQGWRCRSEKSFFGWDTWFLLSYKSSTSWWLNEPIWKICSSNWIICSSRGENKKYLKPPPSIFLYLKVKIDGWPIEAAPETVLNMRGGARWIIILYVTKQHQKQTIPGIRLLSFYFFWKGGGRVVDYYYL